MILNSSAQNRKVIEAINWINFVLGIVFIFLRLVQQGLVVLWWDKFDVYEATKEDW